MQNLPHEYEPKHHHYQPLHHPLASSSSSSSSMDPRIQQEGDTDEYDDDDSNPTTKPGKRSGRRKIKIEFIEDKSRRHITFSKRKAGIMKKAYELSTLTGTQVLLLVVSETGLVYTFTTPKLQPLVTKPEGKNLIQACLNAPDSNETPHLSPKPSSTTNMIKTDNGSSHNMYTSQQDAKVSLSHSSNYHPDNYAHLPGYQDATHPYESPPTPYPSYSDTNQSYPPTTSYPSTASIRHPAYQGPPF